MKAIRIRNKNIHVKDIVIAIIIALLPFLFYIYKLAPKTQTWDLDLFVVDAREFDDVSIFLWILNTKILIFLSLIIWFVTCKNWWRFIILIPLIIESFKIITLINFNKIGIDEFEFFYSLPLTIPIVYLIYLLSKKLNYYSRSLELNIELNNEIDNIFHEILPMKKDDIEFYSQKFNELKNKKEILSNDIYLKKLLKFRLELIESFAKIE